MLLFCPNCGNLLIVEQGLEAFRFACNTCPYIHNISRRIIIRKFTELKKVGDVLGGSDAWDNVQKTDAPCPSCNHNQAYFMQIQIRSADEPMTTFYKCCNCEHRWNE
ncbi:hypothetical protein GJ496_007946 [Pomphorhynchus laevis]|nr:hypothetical protein GJ496_007946 [Pomphorhynchus laevis]